MTNKIPYPACSETLVPIRNAWKVLSGKWKTPCIVTMRAGNNRFRSIQEV
ncbi:hypothetical protein ACFP1I_32015 [Dyadobacter subterraneus]|uniref:Uncharacterized protein n=1 Tax=Dyadobacter subterraneus TaxID=2773304 RepID=A0ABR9W969_9BACT|nr:hypothetical protein [Dyadobacter subterraneus]MBE9461958.1 hypothetical protein [Dyadobacter subterraneus]